MDKFLFGGEDNRLDAPRIDKSILCKDKYDLDDTSIRNNIVEVDLSKVAQTLGCDEEKATDITLAVVNSIFRIDSWKAERSNTVNYF